MGGKPADKIPYQTSSDKTRFQVPANSAITKTVTFSETINTDMSIIVAACANTNVMVNAVIYDNSTAYVTARNFSSSQVNTDVTTTLLSDKAVSLTLS